MQSVNSNLNRVSLWICCSFAQSCPTVCDPMTAALQAAPAHQWYHPISSSSVAPFSCPQSFPASGSFPISRLFASGYQSIGASASVLPMNVQGWSPLGLPGWISLLSKGLSRVFSSTTVRKRRFFLTQSPLWSNSDICTWPREKP